MNNLLRNLSVAFTLSGLILLLNSCKKEVDLPISNCLAGAGGEVTVNLFPKHHGDAIGGTPGYPDSAFIKFNTEEYPGDDPNLYDLVVAGDESSISVPIENLKCGNYYIYMTGFDQSIAERVRGGIPVQIQIRSGSLNINIPVTED